MLGLERREVEKRMICFLKVMACGFHRLCAFIINCNFEQVMTTLKTKKYNFVNMCPVMFNLVPKKGKNLV